MFFKINNERKLGFKKLSSADLGLNGTSHQTHIGLYEGMLDFLDDADTTDAMLIYNDYCDILVCDFNRIQNPDGTFRSPKIRKGTDGSNTIVRQIREFAAQHPNRDYYLLWSGLDDNEILFWLLDNTSPEYQAVRSYLPQENRVYNVSDIQFTSLLNLLETKVDSLTITLQEEIEIASQTGSVGRKYKSFDLERAEKRMKEVGRMGEELVAEYLERQKHAHIISSYIWCNQHRESGKPFDFEIDRTRYVDVKSTQYSFEQKLVFSDSELEFVSTQTDESYSVYRVFNMANADGMMRICSHSRQFISGVYPKVAQFKSDMCSHHTDIRTMKIAIEPNVMFSHIGQSINL